MTSINNNNNEIKLNSITSAKISQENDSIEDVLSELKENMANRCEKEVPDYGDFAPVKETLSNKDENLYAGNVELSCIPSEDEPQKRYLNYNQYNPQNRKGLSCLIAAGSKEDILNKLNDENLVNELQQDSERLAEKMKLLKW